MSGRLPEGWEDALPTFTPEDKGLATRLHSQTMLNALSSVLPGQPALLTGSLHSASAAAPATASTAGASPAYC